MSTSFSFVPGLNRLCRRSASQQIESVLPLPARMVDEILAADVALRGEVRRDVVRHLPHQAALVVAREEGEGRALRLVLLRLALGHADQEERERLEQLLLGQHLAVKELHRIFVRVGGRVGQPHVVPAEVLLPARVGGGHHVAGVGGEVEERMPENLVCVVAGGELRDGVMHVLVLLVLQLQSHDGQAVEEEDEINFLVGRSPEVEMRAEGDAVLAVFLGGGALGGAGLGVEQPELQPAHLQPVAQEHPQRRVRQFLAQRLEHLVPRIRAVVVRQLLERVGLRGFEEGPELVFGDEMLGVRDVGLFEHAITVLADEVIRDVLLKGQFGGLLARHAQSPCTSAPHAGQRKRFPGSS